MGRSPIASSRSLFGSGTHARVLGQASVNAGGVSVAASVNVEFAGVTKSAWKR